MKNNFSKKFIASLMLSIFMTSNTILAAGAMENAIQSNKPVLRESASATVNAADDYSLTLKGDVSLIKTDTPVSISLRDSDVKQVLRMFADKAGMNIVFHKSVDGEVTLDLVDVPLNSAFNMVLGISGLNYIIEDGTIIVAKAGDSDFNMGKQDMTLIPVKYLNASAIAEFLNKNIYGIKKPGFSGSEIVTTNPATNELIIFGSKNDVAIAKKIVEKFDKKPQTTMFKVNHTTPAEMAQMICDMLLPSAGASAGGGDGGSSSDGGGGSETGKAAGIATGFAAGDGGGSGSSGASNMALNVGTVVCTQDGKYAGEVSSLGLQNLSVAYYAQLGTISVIGGSEQQLEMIRDFINQTDKKQQQAYLEVAIIELNESGSKTLQNNWTILSNAFSASFNGESLSTDPLHPVFFKGDGYTLYDVSGDTPKELYTVGKSKGPMTISYAINYLVRNSKGRVVANPKVIITSGEEATIDITQDYIESTESEQSAYAGGTLVTRTYNIEEDAGIKVSIIPFISPDGYVTLNIKPEYSTIIEQVPAQDSAGTYVAATLLSHRNLDLKNIRIKDGETLVIAGLINEEEQKSVSKVPVLGDIPGIGAMFRSTTSNKKKNEMVIMLTPKIITDTEDAVSSTDTL